jgi:hypothetical protein
MRPHTAVARLGAPGEVLMNRVKIGAFIGWMPFAVVLLAAQTASAQEAGARVTGTTGGSDHDAFVGHAGVGWFGTRRVPLGPAGPAFPLYNGVDTPAVGIRYWLTPMIGVDGGIGFTSTSGSTHTEPPSVTIDRNSATTFLFHLGVPIALASSGHFSFQLTPEADVGFGTGTIRPAGMPPPPTISQNGFLLQVGFRAGAEIHFGFMGLPALSLDAGLGLFLATINGKNTTNTPAGSAISKDSTLFIGTSATAQPWDILRKDIAARYYF